MSSLAPARAAARPARPAPQAPFLRAERKFTALYQGPGLRKLLGSAGELWERLQRRARRHPLHEVKTSVKALAGRYEAPRTIEWGLKRLEDAHLIERRRTRYGLVIRVLSFDTDEDGLREFSPRLEHETVRWMRTRRKPGRPARPKERPMPTVLPANVTPIRPPPSPTHEALRAEIRAHPDVPKDPNTFRELRPPRVPMPVLLDAKAHPSERREFLIEAYASAVRAFWPSHPIGRAMKALRSRSGLRMLDEAGARFLDPEIMLEPQAWLAHAFEAELKRGRKTPLRAEIVYEPTRIATYGARVAGEVHNGELFTWRTVWQAEYQVTLKGLRQLSALYTKTLDTLYELDHYDEEQVRAIVKRFWPTGWTPIYQTAMERIRQIENELVLRVRRGEFIWRR